MVKSMDTIVNLCKARGYIYPGSEIYGGLANTWDYGPLGSELKNNVKKLWRKKFIQECKYNVGLDAAILMNPQTWVASGHVGGFSDPLIDCKECKTRHRADKLIEEWAHENGRDMIADGMTDEQMIKFMDDNNICCPNCGKHNFTSIRKFNLMFKTFQGVTEDAKAEIYLRPETAQGIFVNFKNVMRTTRKKLPMGIAQIGKAFRNEITPGNFTFRTREFEQMELEFFCKPGTDLEWFDYWKKFCKDWLLKLGIKEENIRLRDHSPEELVFYSKATTDIEFAFPFGWGELWGIADRTDFDLKSHMAVSKEDLKKIDMLLLESHVLDKETKDTVVKLHEKGYYLGIISNNSVRNVKYILKREGIENYFNKIVISEEVGERKPNLKIYLKAFEDIPKEEYEKIIFVSDEILEDLLGVKILGVKTVWYEQTIINKWKKKEEILIEPDYKIKSIKELLDIV